MDYEEIRNLQEEEFFALAKYQCVEFPDILQMLVEEEVIECFYDYYKRKRVKI